MMRTLGLTVLGAAIAAATGVAMLGWAYEGPRRFIRRVKLRKVLPRSEEGERNGTGINSASATWGSDIKARIVTDNLVDTPISVK